MTNPKLGMNTGLGKIAAFDLHNLNTLYSSELDRQLLSDKTREAMLKLLEIQYRLHDPNNVDDWLMEILEQARG